MQQVPIQALPNQEFTIILGGSTWDFTIRNANGVTVVSILRDSVPVLSNARAVAGAFIIPSIYEENGNFFFATANQQLPDYTQFNITQSLIYVTADELAVFRAPQEPPITAADFNPIAALPLRFAPQGYT